MSPSEDYPGLNLVPIFSSWGIPCLAVASPQTGSEQGIPGPFSAQYYKVLSTIQPYGKHLGSQIGIFQSDSRKPYLPMTICGFTVNVLQTGSEQGNPGPCPVKNIGLCIQVLNWRGSAPSLDKVKLQRTYESIRGLPWAVFGTFCVKLGGFLPSCSFPTNRLRTGESWHLFGVELHNLVYNSDTWETLGHLDWDFPK